MKEPTRQQIKGAFQKTIERWERIVDEPEYYSNSNCPLCQVWKGACDSAICPIALYVGNGGCCGTPLWKFTEDATPENALAELNFLRKVYIWWIEQEKPTGVVRKKEKKEELVDVTESINVKLHLFSDGTGVVRLYDGSYQFGYIEGKARICSDDKEKYKAKDECFYFRILKKT